MSDRYRDAVTLHPASSSDETKRETAPLVREAVREALGSDEIERIRARWRPVLSEPRSFDGSEDVAALLAALDAKSHEAWQLRQYQADAEGEMRRARNDCDALRTALDAKSAEVERLRTTMRDAVAKLEEHVGDGCAGPDGTGRRGACSECRLARDLRRAAEAVRPNPNPTSEDA